MIVKFSNKAYKIAPILVERLFLWKRIDVYWKVDVGANEGSAEGIEITFKRGSRIAATVTPPNIQILPFILEGILDPPNPPKIILITWQLTMTGQLILVPTRALQRASKSP